MALADYDVAFPCERSTGELTQRRFGIECVDVTYTAAHEEGDNAFRSRGNVRLLHSHRDTRSLVATTARQKVVCVQQPCQTEAAESAAAFEKELPSG